MATLREVEGAYLLSCTACGSRLLVDPRDQGARLFHHGDGAHHVIPAPDRQGAITPATRAALRVNLLAIAVRLQDLTDDLDRALAEVDGGLD